MDSFRIVSRKSQLIAVTLSKQGFQIPDYRFKKISDSKFQRWLSHPFLTPLLIFAKGE
jgi:hypothetical protein